MAKKEKLEKLRELIVSSAAKAIIEQMTPELMQEACEDLLQNVVGTLTSSRYGSLANMIEKKAKEALEAHLKTKAVQAKIKTAVEKGVTAALVQMPAEATKVLTHRAVEAAVTAATTPPKRSGY